MIVKGADFKVISMAVFKMLEPQPIIVDESDGDLFRLMDIVPCCPEQETVEVILVRLNGKPAAVFFHLEVFQECLGKLLDDIHNEERLEVGGGF